MQDALETFYRDHGRFPTQSEGLDSLFADPGTGAWRGPYLSASGVAGEALADARGQPIVYAISGSDATLASVSFPDLSYSVSPAATIQEWIPRTRAEIALVHDAAERYRQSAGTYPSAITDLVPTYIGSDYRSDPWGTAYLRDSPTEAFYSAGPDRQAGTGDDIRAAGQ